MSSKQKVEKVQAPTPRDIFEGVNGRPPKTQQELDAWLASDEGRAAMSFESTSASRWGEVGRS